MRTALGMAACAAWMALWPMGAAAAPKDETQPLLRAIDKEHCLALYDTVELKLKGTGDDVASVTTRNGLKDFLVVRPGVVDCTGERDIPWRDDKDRTFIVSTIAAAGEAQKPPVDLMKTYAIGPALRATVPLR